MTCWTCDECGMSESVSLSDIASIGVPMCPECDVELTPPFPEPEDALLDALEWVVKRLERGGKAAISDAISQAKAAIIKAKGDSDATVTP